jgi:hypothetical protein
MKIKEIVFTVMVMYYEILKKAIEQHSDNNTDFQIIEIIDGETFFCKIKVILYKNEDIFNLGHRLSVIEHIFKQKGKIDW